MKTLFYTIIFLFTSVLACAQTTGVRYISFFPPAHITHSEVTLEQNLESFDYLDELNKQSNTNDYHAKQGGLVLGAAKDAKIDIDKISIATHTPDVKVYAISTFTVENVIDVSSQGSIGRVIVGVPCTKDGYNCQTAFLSANNVTLPVTSTYDPGGITINLHSSQVSDVAGLSVKSAGFFIPKVSGYLLKWVWLRIDGTGTCNRYLIRYSNDSEPHNDECVAPQDLENC